MDGIEPPLDSDFGGTRDAPLSTPDILFMTTPGDLLIGAANDRDIPREHMSFPFKLSKYVWFERVENGDGAAIRKFTFPLFVFSTDRQVFFFAISFFKL
jgi:hypothetical protein